MTPQLRQAIKILQVSRAELETLVDDELTENPVLEEQLDEPTRADAEVPTVDGQSGAEEWRTEAPTERGRRRRPPSTRSTGRSSPRTTRNDMHGSARARGSADDDDERRAALENTLVQRTLLPDHLMLAAPAVRPLRRREGARRRSSSAASTQDGYLMLSASRRSRSSPTSGRDIEAVERVLRRIQEFDPPGVAARDLAGVPAASSCASSDCRTTRCPRASCAIYLADAREPPLRPPGAASSACRSSRSPRRTKVISVLEPKPGRDYGDRDTRYVTPDVFVQKVGDEYVVTLNEDGMPRLRVSPFYRRMLGHNAARPRRAATSRRRCGRPPGSSSRSTSGSGRSTWSRRAS